MCTDFYLLKMFISLRFTSSSFLQSVLYCGVSGHVPNIHKMEIRLPGHIKFQESFAFLLQESYYLFALTDTCQALTTFSFIHLDACPGFHWAERERRGGVEREAMWCLFSIWA